jgi:plasmid stabilization system protein ParE
MKAVEYHPLAFEELIDSAEYYEARAELLGESFLDEVERAVADVSESPERWPYFLLNSRRRLLDRFPYSIVYLIETDRIYVLAVMHQRRRPGYWRKRLNSGL